jgi:mono/diheme cytochrome c family protein
VRKIIIALSSFVIIAGMGAFAWKACAADEPMEQADEGGGAAAGGDCCKADDQTPPLDLVKNTPKGGLHNPYADKVTDAAFAEEGHKTYLSAGCNGCHGGGGGGGMCPPLTNDTWVYGPDDDTLFRLVTLGSDGLKDAGYHRVKQEVVVGPMPQFGTILKTSDQLWKIITFIRSVNPSSVGKPPLQ